MQDAARQATRPRGIEARADHSRAEAAYKEEFNKWMGLIDAAANDASLSRDQRAAAVAALRLRQEIAAKAVRHRALQEERHKVKAIRREARRTASAPTRDHT